MPILQDAMEHTDGKTLILSNGSGCLSPSTGIQKLLDVLSEEVLDPMFEEFHCYRPYPYEPVAKVKHGSCSIRDSWRGATAFFGNFATVSHVFNIVSRDPSVIGKLTTAISKNVQTDAYQRRAYKLYADWHYAKTCDGYRLVSPSQANDIRGGSVTKTKYPRNFDTMKTAVLLGPRFEGAIQEAS
jgi:hypothetical protein